MEQVTCSIDIELTDPEDVFGDGWDFRIGIYQFQRISEDLVRITFCYEDEVRHIAEDGVEDYDLSTWTKNYVEAEENLQTLLDVVTFQRSGIGLRLLPHTLEMRSASMTSPRSEQRHQVSITDHDEIEARYSRTINHHNEKLIDALRLSRLAANEENEGEKIGQLWGAVERLYASDPPKVLDTKDKRKEIGALIDKATLISNDEKTRLKQTLVNTYRMSKPSVIAEKFGLIGGDGEKRSEKDVKEELDYWIGTRSIQSHGEILMRNRDVNTLAGTMDHIIETALGGEIKPAKYVYIVYLADSVSENFLSSQRAVTKIDKNTQYSFTPLHKFAAFNDLTDRLRHSLREDNSELFVVDYKSVTCVKRTTDTDIILADIHDDHFKDLLAELQNKLNGEIKEDANE